MHTVVGEQIGNGGGIIRLCKRELDGLDPHSRAAVQFLRQRLRPGSVTIAERFRQR